MRAFEAAARYGSFKQAALELGVTHGAISRQVHLLEDWLGPPALFRRTSRGVELTPEGTALRAEAAPALDGIAAAARQHRERRGQPSATLLRVNALATFSLRWLLPRLAAFRREQPGIEVHLTTSNDPVEALSDEFDVVIRGGPDTFYGFDALPIVGERRLPICSPAVVALHPLRTVADLEHHTLLHVATMPRLWRDWLNAAGLGGLRPASALTLDHFYLAIQAAADGLGVVVGPATLVQDDLAAGRLVTPFQAPSMPARSYFAYLPQRGPRHEAAQGFVAWLAGMAAPPG